MKSPKHLFALLLAILCLVIAIAPASATDKVTWEATTSATPQGEILLKLTARIPPQWHLYSMTMPEGGPNPTTFTFTPSSQYSLVGSLTEHGNPIIAHDDLFDVDLTYFEDTVSYTQMIKPVGSVPIALSVSIDYQTCFQTQCHMDDYTLELSITPEGTLSEPSAITAPQSATATTAPEESDKAPTSLGFFFIICFLAGLAGLLTPCVFPMIPMTVSFFLAKKNRTNALLNALFFALSIIAIYTLLGLLVSLTGLGAGFITDLTTHWITNLIFFLLFLIFGAAFFGLFEIRLPSSLSSKTDSKVDKGGFLGTFFFALTTVIVSLSCVGPIVGALLVESASGTSVMPTLGMFAFSLGFSIPFALFAIFPSWLNRLPKSGGWMNSVKVVLGFVVLAFSLKFLLGVDTGLGTHFLSRPLFIAIWIGLALFLTLYLLGFIRFKMDSPLQHLGFFRFLLALTSFTFALYLLPGLFGAPLTALSGFLPAQRASDFSVATSRTTAPAAQSSIPVLCEQPLYADFIDLPMGLQGYRDYQQAIQCAKQTGRPVLIEFTGHGCANCKEMAAKVLSQPEVSAFIMQQFIFVALYVDEKYVLAESQWYTSSRDGQIKKTIGKQNIDLQATKFNAAGQPNFFIVSPDETILAGPLGRELDPQAFMAFLRTGLEAMSKGQ